MEREPADVVTDEKLECERLKILFEDSASGGHAGR